MTSKKIIQFCDLKPEYLAVKKDVDSAVSRVLSSGWYILGKEVESFEKEFAKYCGSSFGIGVGSGTEALHIALLACGIRVNDEVITVANAGVPMVVAILLAGARPVFVDINPESYTMDPLTIEKKITDRTRVILPVHLYGQAADMTPILRIAKKYKLKVIEDAAQAHGATYHKRKVGSLADIGCFSFYPTKNLGCFGDGGIVITNNSSLADKLRLLRDYGQKKRYDHVMKGLNSRLDEIQAAVLLVRLRYLDKLNHRRIKIAKIYNNNINNALIIKPRQMGYGAHVYHLYVIASKYRDRLKKYLADNGIQALVHYPTPVYRQKAYAEFKFHNLCAVTDKSSRMVLSLPVYPSMPIKDVYKICDVINKFHL